MSFTQETPISLRIAQTIGITASAFLFGQNASISYIGVPSIMLAPAPIAIKQWANTYNMGHYCGPPLAIVSALATGWCAWNQDTTSPQYKLNLAATVLIPSIIPFTFAFIVPTNNALFEKKRQLADVEVSAKDVEVGVKKEETVHALIDKWATLNLARALLVGLGSVCAVWGAVGRMEGVRRSVL